jgi:hypothetical protein
MPTTPILLLPYPAPGDPADVPTDMNELATRLETVITASGGYGTSLPGSPTNGQEYTLVDSITNPSYQWRFRYNSGSTSPYKWEFVGGSHVVVAVNTQENHPGGSAWANLPTNGPLFTVPRGGDYLVIASTASNNGAAGTSTGQLGPAVGDTTPPVVVGVSLQSGFASGIALQGAFYGVTAGNILKLRYWSNSNLLNFSNRVMTVTPIRVS